MSNEDKVGKMLSRVDLVAEVEEYEELIEGLKQYYTPEEVDFVMKNPSYTPQKVSEFAKMRVY